MPVDPVTGQCIPFTPAQIAAMKIQTFKVRDQSHPTEERLVGASTMQRTFLVDWFQRYDFFELVLGNVSTYTLPPSAGAGTIGLSRLLPDPTYGRAPDYPPYLLNEIIAMKIASCKGFGKNLGEDTSGMPYYTKAEVVVDYELVPWNLLTDAQTLLTGAGEYSRYNIWPTEGDSDAEFTTMPGGCLHWIVQGGSTTLGLGLPIPHMRPITFNIGKVTPTQKRTWTWVRIPASGYYPGSPLHTRLFYGNSYDGNPPGSAPYTVPFIGSVNSKPVGGYQPGTLLLESVGEVLKRDVLGSDWVYDLKFHWNFRPTGWLFLPYFDPSTLPDGSPANPGANGYYFFGKGNQYYDATNIPDDYGLYNSRDHSLVWQLG